MGAQKEIANPRGMVRRGVAPRLPKTRMTSSEAGLASGLSRDCGGAGAMTYRYGATPDLLNASTDTGYSQSRQPVTSSSRPGRFAAVLAQSGVLYVDSRACPRQRQLWVYPNHPRRTSFEAFRSLRRARGPIGGGPVQLVSCSLLRGLNCGCGSDCLVRLTPR
jgi:hypothetical protein